MQSERGESGPESPGRQRKRVLILGAGFAGKAAADSLCERLGKHEQGAGRASVLLVDKRNYQLFTPMLYQAATGLVNPTHIAVAVRPDAKKRNFSFLKASVRSIDLDRRLVVTTAGTLAYDYLVLALGSVADVDRISGAREHAIALKTADDAEVIHNRILSSLEEAARLSPGDAHRTSLLTFVVIGGSTGSELAGSLLDYVRLACRYYPSISPDDCRVVIVERHERLFPGGDEALSNVVKKALEERGVEVRVNVRVSSIENSAVVLGDGSRIESENVFWNAGTKPSPLMEALSGAAVDKHKGRVVVDAYLRLPGCDEVYAVGDVSAVARKQGHDRDGAEHGGGTEQDRDDERPTDYVPPTAEAALEEGSYVGRRLASLITATSGEGDRDEPAQPFHFKDKGTMLSLGHRYGVVKLKHLTLKGMAGWMVWRLVHVALLSSRSGRFNVLVDWMLGSFKERDIAELGEVTLPTHPSDRRDARSELREEQGRPSSASYRN